MRVLYSCLSQSWGGMEMYTVQSVQNLIEREIHTELLCFPGSKIEEMANSKGIKTHPISATGYFHPSEIFKLKKIIKNGEFSLVHTQASKDLWVLVPALKLANSIAPLILTKQVGSFIEKKDFLHRYVYNRVTLGFAISNVIKENLIATTPLNEGKIRIVHNGIYSDRFDPEKISGKDVRAEFEINDDQIVIGMLARFSWGKGHEDFLEAAKILKGKYDNLKFMIVGEASRGEDDYANKIKKMSEDFGLSNEVIFTGFRSDTPEVIASMDIFAFPSHSEAFGIALAEAMASAKPSVTSASDGVLDLTVDGETGYFFEKQNAADMSDKLAKLIVDKDKRIKFGEMARKRAIEKFDFKYITDRSIEFYNQALRKE